jgi:hypothetical protein
VPREGEEDIIETGSMERKVVRDNALVIKASHDLRERRGTVGGRDRERERRVVPDGILAGDPAEHCSGLIPVIR